MARCIVPLEAGTDFSLANLPYGVIEPGGLGPRPAVAIGDYALDLRALVLDGVLTADGARALASERGTLDEFIALEPSAWASVRAALVALLSPGSPLERDGALGKYLHRRDAVRMRLPCAIGDYTDFYSSLEHARNVGTMFRGATNALMPNWTCMPIGYHGRASSVVVSGGADPRRPCGQLPPGDASAAPSFGASAQMDYELELGFIIGGRENPLGSAEPVATAERRVFGCVLVNDWSARDIQRWEYVPLGPFGSKNFCTTISPWVVPLAALEDARRALPRRLPAGSASGQRSTAAAGDGDDGGEDGGEDGDDDESSILPYLRLGAAARARASLSIELEVALSRANWPAEAVVCRGNARALYWSVAQQIAHHTVTGCNLRAGDLLATGTISGAIPESAGCLLERTWRGERPLPMPDGSARAFLLDGDTVTMRGAAVLADGTRIGFGECVGTVMPAQLPSEGVTGG
ncbi:hypothetical protein KFE25_009565 [Diacronema lutheri]|uniref:Fumarylacetoacetase n=1 Tax=Diacronema lutheri TaxID=2081491 RepID=A0A8J6CFW9_DIALT|nr:hypothetical protein KFE25_009565 [Diacronema lutheri]